MSIRRIKGLLLGASAVLAGLLFVAWAQPWFVLTLVAGVGDGAPLEIRGDVAAEAVVPLALTTLALTAALAIAGPGFRVVLGALEVLLGAAIVTVVLVTLGDPVRASSSAVTDLTGIAGRESVAELVSSVETSAWPTAALTLGVLLALVGAAVAATAARWPTSGQRYSRTRAVAADGEAPDADSVSDWDALSDGDDPTTPAH